MRLLLIPFCRYLLWLSCQVHIPKLGWISRESFSHWNVSQLWESVLENWATVSRTLINCHHILRFHSRLAQQLVGAGVGVTIRGGSARKGYLAVIMYKIHNDLSPLYPRRIFTNTSNVHTHTIIRNSELNYYVPRLWAKSAKGSLHYRESVLWNKISWEIRNLPSLNIFKTSFHGKDYLIHHESLEPFIRGKIRRVLHKTGLK